jgi:hypothetical protein
MNDHNNGNGNGNGHKVFELAKTKTPEEIAQDATRKMSPEIRRAVNCMKLPMAVKGFFSALLDFTFLHCYGGSGRGKIFISIRDLCRLLKHDKDSIAKWRDVLLSEKLIWFREGWPTSEWRICALCPAPVTDFSAREQSFIRGRAAALETDSPAPPEPLRHLPHGVFAAPEHKSPSISEEIGQTGGTEPVNPSEDIGGGGGERRRACPTPSATFGGERRSTPPTSSAKVGENVGHPLRHLPHGVSDNFRTNKESPMEKRSLGDKGGGEPPPKLPKFERLDPKAFDREREKIGNRLIETCREKIFALENTRTPVKGRAEIVSAYRARIKEIKAWQNRELAP